jgi:Flp pilus assembly protein TadG
MSGKVRKFICAIQSQLLRDCGGSELIELAIALPILLVMAMGVAQFGGAFNLKQIVNNAAREGARTAANEFSDFGTLSNCGSGSCVAAVAETVSNYLNNAGVNPQCAFSTTGASSGTYAWTFTASGTACSSASLTVERAVAVVNGASTITSTRVTLTYPSPYSMGGLLNLLPGGSGTMPTSLTSDAIMANIN